MTDVYSAFLSRYKRYTDIQERTVGPISNGENCLIMAPTGSGKTEAAVIPMLDRITRDGDLSGIKLIYITPLRALNRDMILRLEAFCNQVGVTISVRHGDTTQAERARQVKSAPMVLITTPETLQSILPTKSFSAALKNVMAVVVDEVHELYGSKRGAQLSVALERLEERAPGFQRVGISATISDPETVKRFLCGERPCMLASVDRTKEMEIGIEMPKAEKGVDRRLSDKFGLDAEAISRLHAVARNIKGSKSAIIFANTRQIVEALGSRLLYMNGIEDFGGIGVHHSSLDRASRIEIENEFKAGRIKSIIATSSLELGIDIGAIDLVIQYGSPRQALRLIQRVGRSGHTAVRKSKGAVVTINLMDALESAAISINARAKVLESYPVRFNALDVLANQICGIMLDKGTCKFADVHAIIRRSFVYKDMGEPALKDLLAFMNTHRMIGYDGDMVTSGGRTRMYYYDHLSVIPDSKRFRVKSMADNRLISSLDENFVASNVEEGSVFITKGLPWKVISIDEDVISVEPSSDLEAAVPDWSGEDIPVSYDVVQTVYGIMNDPRRLSEADGLERELREDLRGFIARQEEAGMPSPGKLLIERSDEYDILHTGLGTLANEALSRLIAHRVAMKYGRSINMKSSPYLIFLEISRDIDIVPILKELCAHDPERLLEEAIPDTDIFRYRFVTIAKLFGMIDRETTVSRSLAKRLIRVLHDTPVYRETLRELLKDYFDTRRLREFFEGIGSGKIKITASMPKSLSPISKTVLNSAYYTRELIMPLLPSDEIIHSFERFMLSKSMKLVCTYCGFMFTRPLSELKDQEKIGCPSCASPLIAPFSDEYVDVINKRKEGRRMTKKSERETLNEMMKQASLFSSYGGKAAVALSTYGVGPTSAARILMMFRREDRSFYLDLLDAQKNFIKNRKYWSI